MRLFWSLVGALAVTGCVRSGQGFVKDSESIVTIGGGQADVGGGNAWRAWYYVDRTSQTCWMEIGQIGGQVDCCKIRNVKEATPYITWESAETCGAKAVKPSTDSGQ